MNPLNPKISKAKQKNRLKPPFWLSKTFTPTTSICLSRQMTVSDFSQWSKPWTSATKTLRQSCHKLISPSKKTRWIVPLNFTARQSTSSFRSLDQWTRMSQLASLKSPASNSNSVISYKRLSFKLKQSYYKRGFSDLTTLRLRSTIPHLLCTTIVAATLLKDLSICKELFACWRWLQEMSTLR